MGIKLNVTKHRIVAAGLALAITVAVSAAHVTYAGDGTPPTPVDHCTDYACEP